MLEIIIKVHHKLFKAIKKLHKYIPSQNFIFENIWSYNFYKIGNKVYRLY